MKPFSQRGFFDLLLIFAVLVIAVIVIFIVTQGFKILPTFTSSKNPAFNIKTEYQNPFRQTDQDQYVNPFENLK